MSVRPENSPFLWHIQQPVKHVVVARPRWVQPQPTHGLASSNQLITKWEHTEATARQLVDIAESAETVERVIIALLSQGHVDAAANTIALVLDHESAIRLCEQGQSNSLMPLMCTSVEFWKMLCKMSELNIELPDASADHAAWREYYVNARDINVLFQTQMQPMKALIEATAELVSRKQQDLFIEELEPQLFGDRLSPIIETMRKSIDTSNRWRTWRTHLSQFKQSRLQLQTKRDTISEVRGLEPFVIAGLERVVYDTTLTTGDRDTASVKLGKYRAAIGAAERDIEDLTTRTDQLLQALERAPTQF